MALRNVIIGLLLLSLVALGGWYFYPRQEVSPGLSHDEARAIAQSGTCTEKGTVAQGGQYNADSKAWQFDLTIKDEFRQEGCSPACVVLEEAKTSEIDWRCPGVTPPPDKSNLIRVSAPTANQIVKSPFIIEGEARGTWYFEASFPVRIIDANGNQLGITPAQAEGEWMTEDFVPFKTELSFTQPSTETGTLILEKDNPSGLPEHADEIRIPVRFDLSGAPQRNVKLYYYDPSRDEDESGNIKCSRDGLVAVERRVPVTITPIQDTIKLLLKGNLTQGERAEGITTEYPLAGVELKAASLTSGTLTLTFDDPQNKTSGGSCRAEILRFQIEATARQFPGVTEVRFMPEELFQP